MGTFIVYIQKKLLLLKKAIIRLMQVDWLEYHWKG